MRGPYAPAITVAPALQRVWVPKRKKMFGVLAGAVAVLGGGTYASQTFAAVVPAQNAMGNWIKVVQRVPVRIALDSKQLNEHPLRVGLTMHVEVDVSE